MLDVVVFTCRQTKTKFRQWDYPIIIAWLNPKLEVVPSQWTPQKDQPTFVESYITSWSDSEASLRRFIMNFPGELAIHWWRIRLGPRPHGEPAWITPDELSDPGPERFEGINLVITFAVK